MTEPSRDERSASTAYKPFRRIHFAELILSHAEAGRLGDEIRRAFADVKFVSLEYWKHYVDWRAWRRDIARARRAESEGLPSPYSGIAYHMADPSSRPLRYFDSIADAAEDQFYIWREPRGWAPVWGPVNQWGHRWIINIPRLHLIFQRGEYDCEGRVSTRRGGRFVAPPRPSSETAVIRLLPGQLAGSYQRDDAEQMAFQFKVASIVRRMTTAGLYRVDSVLRRPYRETDGREVRRRSLTHRYGLGAERWALARRDNYFAYVAAPGYYKPVTYPYAPEDFIHDEELPLHERRRRERIVESTRALEDMSGESRARHERDARARTRAARAKPRAAGSN